MKILCFALSLGLLAGTAMADSKGLYDLPIHTLDGKPTTLAEHKGKALLIVNVASKCGYTRQYKGLESVYKKYKSKGLVVLGFPCNQFGRQEPGSAEEIASFCEKNFGVTFPLYEKIDVNGDNRHPIYNLLAGKESPFPGDIRWNFNKFLVGTDGKILKRYASRVEPNSSELSKDIETALN